MIVFDDMIAICSVIKKFNPTVTELFIRGRKLNIRLVYIRLNSTHYFVMKIPNEQELQQIVCNHSSDIDFKSFTNLYK